LEFLNIIQSPEGVIWQNMAESFVDEFFILSGSHSKFSAPCRAHSRLSSSVFDESYSFLKRPHPHNAEGSFIFNG